MTLQEHLQRLMAQYCPYDYTNVRMDLGIKNRYVPEVFKRSFTSRICKIWDNVRCGPLHLSMFESLKTGNDILKLLREAGYGDTPDDDTDELIADAHIE